jgi:type I restriction enzyme M protein
LSFLHDWAKGISIVALTYIANSHFNAIKKLLRNEDGGASPDGRWRKFSYDEIIARDKTNLDISWLKDDSLEDTENLQPPAVIASEIVELLTAALEEFKRVEDALVEED